MWKTFDDGISTIALASWGRVPYVFVVIAMALGLAQLELVLRASREPVRHRLKFIVIGLGGQPATRFIKLVRSSCFRFWQAEHVLVSSVVIAMALSRSPTGWDAADCEKSWSIRMCPNRPCSDQ